MQEQELVAKQASTPPLPQESFRCWGHATKEKGRKGKERKGKKRKEKEDKKNKSRCDPHGFFLKKKKKKKDGRKIISSANRL